MLWKLLLGLKSDDKKKNEGTVQNSTFFCLNPVLSFYFPLFCFLFDFYLLVDVSLFLLVKWSFSVPGVEMYAAFSADHCSLSS